MYLLKRRKHVCISSRSDSNFRSAYSFKSWHNKLMLSSQSTVLPPAHTTFAETLFNNTEDNPWVDLNPLYVSEKNLNI
ncbi:hypothetical protein Hanom_Chr04g00380171 [Helianthus anomalus]